VLSLKRGRGPSFQRAIAGLVFGLFGVLWTIIAAVITAEMPFPYVGIVFPAMGVLITLFAWCDAVYHFVNATSQQRFTEYDFVTQYAEPDPLQSKFAAPSIPSPEPAATKFCVGCGTPLEATFKFCPQCGAKA
jgi:hypothetical protein